MRLTQLTLQNFRSFGTERTTVDVTDLTTLIGSNGSGKTTLLLALSRLFGTGENRNVKATDFHVPPGETLDGVDERSFVIDARFDFPELEHPGADQSAVAECFQHMIISGEGETPFCLLRLDATWSKSALPEGDIIDSVSWLTSTGDSPEKRSVSPTARSRIQLLYVPATRDPSRQLRQVSGSLLARLFKAISWSEETRTAIEQASAGIAEIFRGETGVASISETLTKVWSQMQHFSALASVGLRPIGAKIDDVLRNTEVIFSPGEGGSEHTEERLSDGLKSLFYLALVTAVFDIEELLRSGKADTGLSFDQLRIPSLTIFAVEEVENHLAPHYLGRILSVLRRMAEAPNAQVLFTTHSPAILARIKPEEVRHFHLVEGSKTRVRAIKMPEDDKGEAYKYLKEAVRAYPELYFSNLVVLGEGDSEEIVIPRIAVAEGVEIDGNFVSVVPLGGRHVNHLWRLLNDLEIPFVTLLDLDRERGGGGGARIKYACNQLLSLGADRKKLLRTQDVDGKEGVLTDAELNEMEKWNVHPDVLNSWAGQLEEFDVFFAAPLDIDFLMLRAFRNEYQKAKSEEGPRIPKSAEALKERLDAARAATLKSEKATGATFSEDEKGDFIWYQHLFLGRGKPATHIIALNEITDAQLRTSAPPVLKRLADRMKLKLNLQSQEATDNE